jgi:hypothetical protein
MGIAVASVILVAVILFLTGLSFNTLKKFSRQDSLQDSLLEPLIGDDSSEAL